MGSVWFLSPNGLPNAARNLPQAHRARNLRPLLFALICPLVSVTWPIFRFIRYFDRAMRRALEKANAGDKNGAMDDIRADIEAKGLNGPRANALGVVHLLRQEWQDALLMFRPSGWASTRGVSRTSQAMAIHKAGDSEGALPILQEQFDRNSNESAVGCNLCYVLLALNRGGRSTENNRGSRESKEEHPLSQPGRGRRDRSHDPRVPGRC